MFVETKNIYKIKQILFGHPEPGQTQARLVSFWYLSQLAASHTSIFSNSHSQRHLKKRRQCHAFGSSTWFSFQHTDWLITWESEWLINHLNNYSHAAITFLWKNLPFIFSVPHPVTTTLSFSESFSVASGRQILRMYFEKGISSASCTRAMSSRTPAMLKFSWEIMFWTFRVIYGSFTRVPKLTVQSPELFLLEDRVQWKHIQFLCHNSVHSGSVITVSK